MANPLLAEGYGGLHDFIEHVEYQYVKKVLKDCDGSVVRAAKKLDIHRSSLYRILNKENK
jgi:ActR/RegA family two-component response regulator